MTVSGTLIQQVADRLRTGPTHTLALAREVLGLSGHPGAASAAIFALLGNDPRFQVNTGGVWSMAADREDGPSLAELSYAVVDVETTGGGPHKGHRITEIAIVHVEGGEIVDEFTSLVNPGRSIPPVVSSITGITADMVEMAPFFEHIAEVVRERLEDRIFVAHNAQFDRGFVRSELVGALGEAPPLSPLCTVRMARGLLPRLRRRNLDVLARHFDIPIHGRHRAYGDALATARILLRLLDEASLQGIQDLTALRSVMRRRARKRAVTSSSEDPQDTEPSEDA
ncbi:MAG: 3'-5' exonuclease [Gemmatimonadales bacterium]|nr:MAG: 3'-5' exonuclease [Gemmatimonadales bacterium]